MTAGQLRTLLEEGMTIGAHSRSHADLTKLSDEELRAETEGCRQDLEAVLGTSVRFFAYPGGAFDRRVVEATRKAGFQAACSVLGPLENDAASLFWLYRDTLTHTLRSPSDLYRLSSTARQLLAFRVRRRLRRQLLTGFQLAV
jgi:peptidoglycan/xylan/chitin deacetylase (PgdA/CDA1 family)